MERHFELELEKLKKRVLKMGNLVAQQIHQTMVALKTCDVETAEEIIEADNAVDELDVKIDKLCQRIFALTQPVATDLRLIMSSLKINNDLERMGDQAVDIARKIEGLADFKEVIDELKIGELAEMTDILVKDVMTIMNTQSLTFIRDIHSDTQAVRNKVEEISVKIIDLMARKSEILAVATSLMIILTQIERIAGYSLNIAESIYFVVEGKMVKHEKGFWDQSVGGAG